MCSSALSQLVSGMRSCSHSQISLMPNDLTSESAFHAVGSGRSWRACLSKASARQIFENRSLNTMADTGIVSGPELVGSDSAGRATADKKLNCRFEPGKLLKTHNIGEHGTRRIVQICYIFMQETDRIDGFIAGCGRPRESQIPDKRPRPVRKDPFPDARLQSPRAVSIANSAAHSAPTSAEE